MIGYPHHDKETEFLLESLLICAELGVRVLEGNRGVPGTSGVNEPAQPTARFPGKSHRRREVWGADL
jgi:hypothetical protein